MDDNGWLIIIFPYFSPDFSYHHGLFHGHTLLGATIHPSTNCRLEDADALEAEMKEATKSQHEEMNYSKLQLAALREDTMGDGLKWGWPPKK